MRRKIPYLRTLMSWETKENTDTQYQNEILVAIHKQNTNDKQNYKKCFNETTLNKTPKNVLTIQQSTNQQKTF